MQENNFEKKVQEKMEELRFTPSAPVWQEVERRIRKKSERRRLAFWLPLLTCLLAGGIWWASSDLPGGKPAATTQASPADPAKVPATVSDPANPGTERSTAPSKAEPSEPAGTGVIVPEQKEPSLTPEQLARPSIRRVAAAPEPGLSPNSRTTISPSVPAWKRALIDRNKVAAAEKTATARQLPETAPTHSDKQNGRDEQAAEEIKTETRLDPLAEQPPAILPERAFSPVSLRSSGPVIRGPEAVALPDPVAPEAVSPLIVKVKEPKVRFYAGVSAGISGSVSGLQLGGAKAMAQDFLANPASTRYSGPVSFGSLYYPESEVQEGPSFSLEGGVQKQLGSRLSIRSGLQYSYYSTRRQVGRKTYSAALQNSGPIAGPGQLFSDTGAVYSANLAGGSTYRNAYHLVEWPVALQFRPVRNWPVLLEGGLSGALLLQTNAVHYDSRYRLYYSAPDRYHHFGLFFNGGINVSLMEKGKHPLQLGPQFRYNLVNSEKGRDTHLFFFGLNARMHF